MPNAKLTKTTIAKDILPQKETLKDGGQILFWDLELPGFGLKLTPNKVVYVIQKRVGKRTVRTVLGNYNAFGTPEMARKYAQSKLQELRGGTDLNAEKKKSRQAAATLRQVMQDYLTLKENKLRPKTKQVYQSAVVRCFADWLDRPITEINDSMVASRHKKLSTANGPRGKGEAQANQAMRVLRTLCNFSMLQYKDAEGRSLMVSNPVKYLSQLDLWNDNVRRSDIVKDEQLQAWYEAVMNLESTTTRDYLLLCLFTGLRRSECVKLRYDRIQLNDKPMLTVPREDTKTKSEHNIPLSDIACELLRKRKAARQANKVRQIIADSDYVFPGSNPGSHLIEPKRAIEKVIKESGVDFSLHTLRRTFETIAARLDINYYALKKLLNHSVKADITGGYVVLDVENLREPMQKIADHIKAKAGINSGDFAIPVASK